MGRKEKEQKYEVIIGRSPSPEYDESYRTKFSEEVEEVVHRYKGPSGHATSKTAYL